VRLGTVIWVPDDSLRALAPEEDYGAVAVLRNLEHFRPEDYGLPAMKQD
jgi:pseudouridine-5'-monophosphatase